MSVHGSGVVLVAGAGAAGIAAALAARRQGADVTLVERAFVGGSTVAHSLLPSKVQLAAARDLAAPARWGLGPPSEGALWAVGGHLRWRREAARDAYGAALAAAGVTSLAGVVRFTGAGRAVIEAPEGSRDLGYAAAVVATGSVQHVPAGLAPDGRRVLLPRDLATLATSPAHSVVLGAGPTGVEIASLLSCYGGRVTLVARQGRILPGEDDVLAGRIARALEARGVILCLGAGAAGFSLLADGVEVMLANGGRIDAGTLWLATGRRGTAGGLGLETVGARVDPMGFLAVDRQTRAEGAPALFGAGDVTGPPLVANKAQAQGEAAGVHAARLALGRVEGAGPLADPQTLPVAVFADPEYARVGAVPSAAPAGLALWSGSDLASLHRHVLGREEASCLVRVVTQSDGRVAGAAVLGEAAAERILLFAAAMAWQVPIDRLGELWPVVPTASESLRGLAQVARAGRP